MVFSVLIPLMKEPRKDVSACVTPRDGFILQDIYPPSLHCLLCLKGILLAMNFGL